VRAVLCDTARGAYFQPVCDESMRFRAQRAYTRAAVAAESPEPREAPRIVRRHEMREAACGRNRGNSMFCASVRHESARGVPDDVTSPTCQFHYCLPMI